MTKVQSMTRRRFLDPLEIRTVNHDIHISSEHDLVPVHLLDVSGHGHTADRLVRNSFRREHVCDLVQDLHKSKKAFFKHEIDGFPFLRGLLKELFKGKHGDSLPMLHADVGMGSHSLSEKQYNIPRVRTYSLLSTMA